MVLWPLRKISYSIMRNCSLTLSNFIVDRSIVTYVNSSSWPGWMFLNITKNISHPIMRGWCSVLTCWSHGQHPKPWLWCALSWISWALGGGQRWQPIWVVLRCFQSGLPSHLFLLLQMFKQFTIHGTQITGTFSEHILSEDFVLVYNL